MKRYSLLVIAVGVTTLAACDPLKEALTAHVDVVAKAGSQELAVTRLGDLLGKSKIGIPVNKEVAMLIARDMWVPYQLLAHAAAHGDSLNDPKLIDAAASSMLENTRLGRFMESVASKFPADSGSEESYLSAKGDLYSARHILFSVPKESTPAAKEAVRKKAESIRAQLTDANFADMANKHSEDPGNVQAKKGGDLGVFPRGMMVKPFGDALSKLKAGEISPLVETDYGYHIVQRNTWAQAKAAYAGQSAGRSRQVAESTYIAQAQTEAKVSLKSDAAATVKAIAKDPMGHRNDKTVVATYTGGSLTAGRLALTLLASAQNARLSQQIQGAPDSLVNQYVTNMAQREVLLRRADSVKVALNPDELKQLHSEFAQAVATAQQALGVSPKALADSAKTPAARERLAASRVEAFLDRVMDGAVQPLPVPTPLQIVLMNKYNAKVNAAGVDRAVERATHLRATADSAKAAGQPKSAVPLPMPGAPAPTATPAPRPGTAPAPAKP